MATPRKSPVFSNQTCTQRDLLPPNRLDLDVSLGTKGRESLPRDPHQLGLLQVHLVERLKPHCICFAKLLVA